MHHYYTLRKDKADKYTCVCARHGGGSCACVCVHRGNTYMLRVRVCVRAVCDFVYTGLRVPIQVCQIASVGHLLQRPIGAAVD